MSKRIKLTGPVIKSRAEMESLVGEIVGLQLELNKATVAMDQEIQTVKQKYEDRNDRLAQRIEEKTEVAKAWAEVNPEEFGNKKSIDFVHAVVGFNMGNPKVVPLKKSFTAEVLLALLAKTTWGVQYIRQIPKIDKEGLIADRKTLGADQLAEAGIKIVQDESFYIDPKTQELAGTIRKEAA